MKLRREVLDDIRLYLVSLPSKTVKRGRSYFLSGNVLKLECVEPDRRYSAVVRGGRDYDVTLEFVDEWLTECSCPIQFDCKHGVAALLELQERASANGAAAGKVSVMRRRVAGGQGARSTQDEIGAVIVPMTKASRVPQPPRSPLLDRLVEALGRDLRRDEAKFVRQVQTSYATARVRDLSGADLATLAGYQIGPISYDYWQALELFPELPPDDFHFWLYVAWELRSRNIRWPAFMDAITDFSVIEPAMKDWERAEEIERWKDWFEAFKGHSSLSETGTLELRLAILEKEARLQWRTDANAEFADFKQAHAGKFASQFDAGALNIDLNSLPLWSACYKPWHYEGWWSFKYANATARPALNRLLRSALGPERLVTADGKPLPRATEPLRLNLCPPQNGDGNYELSLATADGAAPPKIFCTLDGQPTLYVTAGGVFQGPPADALETELRKTIPAPALETADGLRFLHAVGVPLPQHLAARIETVPVSVSISCKLQLTYPGSPSEDIVVNVSARAPGMVGENFTPKGWIAETIQPNGRSSRGRANAKAGNGTLTVPDRTVQKHFPRVLEPLELKWDAYPGHWKLRLTKKTPDRFVAWIKSLPPEVEVKLDKELATLRDEPVSGTVSLDIAEAGMDWFDLKVALKVGDTLLTPEELKLLLNARGGYVRLGKKGWRRLHFNITPEEDEQLARIGLNSRDFTGEPQRFHALQLADDAAKKFLGPDRVEQIERRVRDLKTRVAPALPQCIRAEMRPYQTDGYHFLAYLTSNRFGGVLADDMGLGKTVQTLAWLAWLRECSSKSQASTANPSLVVCPKSVMDNWRAEAERFYPDLRVRLWRGEAQDALSAARDDADLIVVNYAQLRSLSPGISNQQWLAAILDEAQYIKNPIRRRRRQRAR